MSYVVGKPTKKDWEKWYHSERWRKLRIWVLARDKYVCQRTGTLCTGKGNAWNAPVVNHKKPHRGNPDLFWDPNNLETVTKQVHDGPIQRAEKNEVTVIGVAVDGRPVDPNHPWNIDPAEKPMEQRMLDAHKREPFKKKPKIF